MNNVQLELEKIIEYFEEQINNSFNIVSGRNKSYEDAKEKCERLMDTVTGVYPESQLEDIQEQ